jgi:hypothetical protein
MRAPMSRMDVLTAQELKQVLADSGLADSYNETVDRESAYEILNQKIARAEEEAEKEAEKEAPPARRSRGYQRQDPLVKVLTSATFIRGVMGILKKVIR